MLFDGARTTEQKSLFAQIFPRGQLLELGPYLKSRNLPDYLQRFVAGNWTAKKLAAVYELQRERSVLYSDCDVLAFQKPEEILRCLASGKSRYMFDESGYTLDPWLTARAGKLGIPVTNQFNAGLVFVPAGEMTETLLEALLSDWQPVCNSHHAEQTLFSILLNPKSTGPLEQSAYVLSWQGVWVWDKDLDWKQMVCRHYTGPVRHRMYLSGYPNLLNQTQNR